MADQLWRQLCEDAVPGLRDRPVAYEFSNGEKFYDSRNEFVQVPQDDGRLVVDEDGIYVVDKDGNYVFVPY